MLRQPIERQVTRPEDGGHVVVPVAEQVVRLTTAAERLRAAALVRSGVEDAMGRR